MDTFTSVMLFFSLCLLIAGTVLSFMSHDKFRPLIWRGGLHDLGVACLGLACPGTKGTAGFFLYLAFQFVVRALAWTSLDVLKPAQDAEPSGSDLWALRGVGQRAPIMGKFFAFAMLATVGGSIFFVPEGRFLIAAASVSQVPEVPQFFYIMLFTAATSTVQVWLMARVACCVLFDKPQHAYVIDDTPSKASLVLAVIAALMGIFKSSLLSFMCALCGFSMHHSAPHISSSILYIAAFVVAICFWLYAERTAIRIAVAATVLGLLSIVLLPSTPLAQMFLLLVGIAGVVIAVYSVDYVSHDKRKAWYWFFLLLTFSSLAGVVSSDNVADIYGYGFWEMMTFTSFILVAHEANRTARNAAIKYFVMCIGGALFMLPGIILLSSDAGQLRALSNAAHRLPSFSASPALAPRPVSCPCTSGFLTPTRQRRALFRPLCPVSSPRWASSALRQLSPARQGPSFPAFPATSDFPGTAQAWCSSAWLPSLSVKSGLCARKTSSACWPIQP